MTPFEPTKTYWTPTPEPTLVYVGVCQDGPWKGRFIAEPKRFVPAPEGNEYCNDGAGFWHWVEHFHEGKK